MASWSEDYSHPDWVEREFDRDRATAERWDRLDDDDARFWAHVDRVTRDLGGARKRQEETRKEAA